MKDCLASPRNRRRRRPRRRRGAEIASGNCVFAEYHTAIHLDYDPATIAGTPIRDVLYTVFLRRKTGGEQKVFRFTGDRGFKGAVPEGDDPFPPGWPHLEVDPTREYCLRMSAQGFGDLARLAVESKEV